MLHRDVVKMCDVEKRYAKTREFYDSKTLNPIGRVPSDSHSVGPQQLGLVFGFPSQDLDLLASNMR